MFWQGTPRAIAGILAAHDVRLIREHNENAWLAWHIGALPRLKRFPKLDSMMVKPKSKPQQNWQMQLAIARMWAARGGGKIKRKVN